MATGITGIICFILLIAAWLTIVLSDDNDAEKPKEHYLTLEYFEDKWVVNKPVPIFFYSRNKKVIWFEYNGESYFKTRKYELCDVNICNCKITYEDEEIDYNTAIRTIKLMEHNYELEQAKKAIRQYDKEHNLIFVNEI